MAFWTEFKGVSGKIMGKDGNEKWQVYECLDSDLKSEQDFIIIAWIHESVLLSIRLVCDSAWRNLEILPLVSSQPSPKALYLL